MRKVGILFKHIMKLTFMKKGNWITFILLPLLGVFAALAFNSGGEVKTKVGIYNESDGYLATDLIDKLKNNDSFQVIKLNNKNYSGMLKNSEIDTALEIPSDFQEKVENGEFEKLNLYSTQGETVTIWIQNYLNFYIDNLVSISKVSATPAEYKAIYEGYKDQKLSIEKTNVEDKTQNKGVTKSSIGFLLVFMLMASKVTTDYVINDKRRRTYTRTFCAPITKGTYILSNILANLVVFSLQLVIILVLSIGILGLNFFIPTTSLIVLFLAFGVAAIAFGVLIAAYSKSTSQASQLSNILIVPTSMLAGCFWPSELMPEYLQKIALALPQTWVLKAVDVLQYGGSLKTASFEISMILLFALVLFTIAIIKMSTDDDAVSLL